MAAPRDTEPRPGQFHADRPTDLRRPNPWHRLAYIIEALPAGLEELARDLHVGPDARVLDYGCADQPYRRFFPPTIDYVGADLPGNPQADVALRPDGSVPVDDASVDAVLSTQVLEHVEDPGLYLAECARVLRPGGRLLLSTHGIMVYHPDPVDLWRWTGEGLQRAVRDAGLEVERVEGIMGLGATGLQLVQDAYYWRLPAPLRPAFAFVVQLLARLADRLETREARRLNALVFALVARKPVPLAAPQLLQAFADAYPTATFVEIGSNDGEQHDHLRPLILARDWTGVMVEPVPYVFERLRHNYGHVAGVALENAAIGPADGEVPFYHLVDAAPEERASLPDWYDGIGSLSKDFVLGHAKHMPDLEERIVCRQVPALTFESLCDRHGLDHVDLLVVDAEGSDWEILRRIDFERRRPHLVIYEHFHLPPADRAAARAHLAALGYDTMEEGFDTFCLHAGADAAVREAWSGLTPGVPGVYVEDEAR